LNPPIDIKEEESFDALMTCCGYMSFLYAVISNRIAQKGDVHSSLNHIEGLGRCVLIKAYELIGYWTAKMDAKKRNSKNTLGKTLKKEERKKEVKKLLSEANNKVDLKFIANAMVRVGKGEDTILTYLDEIAEKDKIKIDYD
jgi:hypothetical protein